MLLYLLLLCAQTTISVFASTFSPNTWDSKPSATHYIVYPDDPGQASQITATEFLLKNLYGDTNVVPIQHNVDGRNQVTDSWRVKSTKSSDVTTAIEVLDGVRLVEKIETHDIPAVRRDEDITYVAMANTTFDWQKTEEFLKSKVRNGIMIMQMPDWDDKSKVVGWYNLALDPDAKAEVEKYEGIHDISETTYLKDFRVIPSKDALSSSQDTHQTPKKRTKLSSREGNWNKQENADKALVMDSQYPGASLEDLGSNFVHVPEPGKGTFVYVVDRGVRLAATDPELHYEFHPPDGNLDNILVLQTLLSQINKQKREEDDSHNKDHGTFVASKALGTRFGLAKEATLISVKMTYVEVDFIAAFRLIEDDLEAHPERRDKSVILIASGSGEPDTIENVKAEKKWYTNYERPMKAFLGMGIPIVLASGNDAEQPNRGDIDMRPQIYQSDEMPLVLVGAASYGGERVAMSQAGQLLTVYAPGQDVKGQGPDDLYPITESGSSVAAPQVAGLIATYLSHEPTRQRWNGLGGVQRVRAIKDYLISDASSWIRKTGSDVRIIWNGAGKDDHEKAVPDPTPNSNPITPPPQPAAPPAPQKTKALSIILQNIVTEADNTNNWVFHLTDQGQSALCRDEKKQKPVLTAPANGGVDMVDNPSWPGGSYSFKIDGMDCEYKNNGQNAGALWCKEKNGEAIPCYAESDMSKKGSKKCDFGVAEHAVVYCEW